MITALKSFKNGIIAAIVGLLIITIGVLWVQRNIAEGQVSKLELEQHNLKNEVLKNKLEASGLRIALDVLEDTYDKLSISLQKEAEIDKEINDAPAEEDGPIAPVLRRTLDGVGRMLHN